jgi:hypothetical protein
MIRFSSDFRVFGVFRGGTSEPQQSTTDGTDRHGRMVEADARFVVILFG